MVNQLAIDVNGLPLAVLELKNPTEEKADIPDLFLADVLLVISAGA
jgi:type I site-specific restriction-modification system R (restriction) subunit